MGRTGREGACSGHGSPPLPPVTERMRLAKPRRRTQTHSPVALSAPPAAPSCSGGGRGGAAPKAPPGKAQAGPSSPPRPWGRMEHNSSGVTRHTGGTGTVPPGSHRHRYLARRDGVAPRHAPGSSPRALGPPWGAGWGCGALSPARGSASGVAPTLPPPPCRAPWWPGRPPPSSGQFSRPGYPCGAAAW